MRSLPRWARSGSTIATPWLQSQCSLELMVTKRQDLQETTWSIIQAREVYP